MERKTFPEFLKEKGVEDIKKETPEKAGDLYVEFIDTLIKAQDEAIKSKAGPEEVTKLTKEISDIATKFNKTVFEQGKAIAKISERISTKEVKLGIVSEIKEKKEDIIKLFKLQPESGEILIKALTNRAAIADNDSAIDIPEITQLSHKRLTMYDSLPKVSVGTGQHNGTIRYYDWDEATTVRAAAMLAEGDTFPESTAKWQKYTIDLKKIGDTLPVTEEFFEDEVLFSAELEMFLRINVDIIINAQLSVGDGTGNNITGLYTSANAYVPAAAGIEDANIYDLHVKVAEDITTNNGSKYMPNVSYMNISDINKYRLKKDANNNYVLPPFVSENGKNIDGMTVIENNDIAANTLVIGDNRFARIYEMMGTEISRGLVDAQFVEDAITLKARRRMLLLVKNQDKLGFRKVTSISAALITIGS